MSVIAAAALLAACGSHSSATSISLSAPSTSTSHASPTTTSSTSSTSTGSSGTTYHYPATIRNALMARCRQNGSRSACNCVVTYFEDNISYAQLKAASIPKLASWAREATRICSGV
jgi:hypothetical protein